MFKIMILTATLIVGATTAMASPETVKLPPFFSQYTSLAPADCVTLDGDSLYKEPEIDFYRGECPSLGGYRAVITGGDLRYHLELVYNGKTIELVSPAAFHSAGVKAEWRFQRTKEKGEGNYEHLSAVPTALIYRLVTDEFNESTGNSKSVDQLVVVRLQGAATCVIGQVKASQAMNIEAQKLADNLSAPCLKELL